MGVGYDGWGLMASAGGRRKNRIRNEGDAVANPEHVEILKQGVEVWNKWRNKNPNIEPDLREASFVFVHLSGVNLSCAKLNDAEFYGAELKGSNLSGADLDSVHLGSANLGKANLSGASLILANLAETNLIKTVLRRADLTMANLRKATLQEAKFSEADLWSADLTNADLSGADFSATDLRRANFSETNLNGVNLRGAKIGRTIFTNMDLSKAVGLKYLRHEGPSTIGIDTLFLSKGKIPESFLRGCGVPEDFIKWPLTSWEYVEVP
jgi:uncharacterized protein YjbI with pentapeptide repeats